MTLVVTTVSSHGITVVGDRAVSRRVGDGTLAVLASPAEKVFYSDATNLVFACWGSTEFGNESYQEWVRGFVSAIPRGTSLADACEELAEDVNVRLTPIAANHQGWAALRRGIHVSGYVGDLPCIYHIHTGDPNIAHHPMRVYRDFPEVHAGSSDAHRRNLARGKYAQLFNGFHELFGVVGGMVGELRENLEQQFAVTIPAPSLRGQLEFSRALVRFAAGLLRAADRAAQVSLEITDVAFTRTGRVDIPDLTPDLPPFGSPRIQSMSQWSGGHHTDAPPSAR